MSHCLPCEWFWLFRSQLVFTCRLMQLECFVYNALEDTDAVCNWFVLSVLPEHIRLQQHSVYRLVGPPPTGWYNLKTSQSQICCEWFHLTVCPQVCALLLKFLPLYVCCQAVENTPGMHLPDTVHNIMNHWTLQMGFPVVTIDTQTGSITQKHFLLDPESVVDRPSQFK